ncbi:hypothetical protein BT69DRAFT_1284839 [Atractiella rhizophila]|nr:hypothetical protein BT69DRAFT_1284839 [Atractiella rhizophila]
MAPETPANLNEQVDDLPTEVNADGKSLVNPKRDTPSAWYKTYQSPIETSNNAFDFHIYFRHSSEVETAHAKQLHASIRREFPELRVYKVFERPVGPHPTGMFEVNIFTPEHFGALFGYLVANRGPLSVLVHPNWVGKGESVKDHSERAVWMGERWPVDLALLRKYDPPVASNQ